MKKVNLRDLYPDVYKTDHFVEVTEGSTKTVWLMMQILAMGLCTSTTIAG